jgi:uncharacterized protein YdaU (DUF1376 family)
MTKGLPWLPWYPADFIAATIGWPFAARGIYRELLDAQWTLGKLPVPEKDIKKVGNWKKNDWKLAWPLIESKFPDCGGFRQNARLEEHREFSVKLRESKALGAAKTNEKRWGKRSHSDTLSESHSDTLSESHSVSPLSLSLPLNQNLRADSASRHNGNPETPTDPRKTLYALGKQILGSNSGGLISQAIRRKGETKVAEVLGAMAVKPTADPRAYFQAATREGHDKVVV